MMGIIKISIFIICGFMREKSTIGIVKFLIGMFFANLIRLFKFIPNNDPIMAITLPFSKQKKLHQSVLFPLLTMISFDIITNSLGVWTIVTSLTYALLGLFFYFYFSKLKKESIFSYLKAGSIGVIIFDFITGVLAMPFMFGMTFEQAFIGQIPFTIMHLITVGFYVIIVTPLIDKHVVKNSNLNDNLLLEKIKAFVLTKG